MSIQNQAIYRRIYTEVVMFTEKPSDETRQTLGKYGFVYRNGQWVKTQPEAAVIAETEVASRIAA